MNLKLFLLSLFIFSVSVTMAQKAQIKGTIVDIADNKKLPNSNILLIRSTDSVLVKSMRADNDGNFHFKNLKQGRYQLLVTYPKMADYISYHNLSDSSNIDKKVIAMELKSKVIEEIIFTAKKQSVRIKGDTISYVADSFQVAAGANVQELLKRLPGVEVNEDGTIKAQGETVNRVLVEGDEFFGDDPLMATKYLKASSVKEIEIYDKKSKTAELTGIDDGKKDKTINIKLKEDAKNGYIGNLDANSNLDDLKDLGGMLGVFKNKLKAAVFGNAANIGLSSQANRAFENLTGGDYDIIEMGDGAPMMMFFAGDGDYFNPANGLPNNKTLGAHISDRLKDGKLGYKLNYKFMDRENTNLTTSNFQRLLPNQQVFITNGNADNFGSNKTNNLKGNTEIKLDSLTTLKLSFGINQNENLSTVNEFTQTKDGNGLDISNNRQQNKGNGSGNTYNGNINYSKKFKKAKRSLSIDLQPEYKDSESNQNSLNLTNYYNNAGILNRVENLNLLKINSGKQTSFASRITYSEPIIKNLSLLGTYSFKNTVSESFKNSYDNTKIIGGKPSIIDSLSNNFDFNSTSHVGRAVLQYSNPIFSMNVGLEATQTNLVLSDLDRKTKFSRNYINLGPNSYIQYKINRNNTFSISYNGSTRQPSLDQLQPVRELNNPLYQVVGNPNLKPSFNNNIYASLGGYNAKSMTYISFSGNYGFVQNEIVSTEMIDANNKRIISYININGNKNYGFGVSGDKTFDVHELSIDASVRYGKTERTALLNNILNKSINENISTRLGFYISPKPFVFNYSFNANISKGNSTVGAIFSGNAVTYTHYGRITANLPYNVQFINTVNITDRPSNAAFKDPLSIQQWDVELSVKTLKTKNLKIAVSVNDILDQRLGYNRNVSGNTISENTFSYIPRYVLLGINYNFSGNFKSSSTQP